MLIIPQGHIATCMFVRASHYFRRALLSAVELLIAYNNWYYYMQTRDVITSHATFNDPIED